MLTILLDQEAIEKALLNYISEDSMNVDLTQKEVNIKLTAGRGENGHKAEIQVSDRETTTEELEITSEAGSAEIVDTADEPAVGPFD